LLVVVSHLVVRQKFLLIFLWQYKAPPTVPSVPLWLFINVFSAWIKQNLCTLGLVIN